MLLKVGKVLLAIFLSLIFTISLWKFVICVYEKFTNEFMAYGVDEWLEENDLGQYSQLFKKMGKYTDRKKEMIFILDTNMNKKK